MHTHTICMFTYIHICVVLCSFVSETSGRSPLCSSGPELRHARKQDPPGFRRESGAGTGTAASEGGPQNRLQYILGLFYMSSDRASAALCQTYLEAEKGSIVL